MPGANRFCSISYLFVWGLSLAACCAGRQPRADKPDAGLSSHNPTHHDLPGAWTPGVRENLQKLIKHNGRGSCGFNPSDPPVVVFDFDNTCIDGDIGKAFFDWMIAHDNIRYSQKILDIFPSKKAAVIRSILKRLDQFPQKKPAKFKTKQELLDAMQQIYWNLCDDPRFDKCFPWQVRFYAGWRPRDIRDMAERVMQSALTKPFGPQPADSSSRAGHQDGSIRIYEEIRTLIATLQGTGFKIWIVSAGPQWVVEAAARYFNVQPPFVIGMRTIVDQGRITTRIDPPPTYKEGKVLAIRKYIGRQPLLAVGDSWSDAEMLGHAQHALLIDRGWDDLQRKARESGWWIQPSFPVQ